MAYNTQIQHYLEQAEQELKENERALGAFRSIEPQLAALVGEGWGAEGRVRATWTQQGLQDLDIDARALRLTSDIVSREVKAAIQGAMDDLRAQTTALVDSLGVKTPEMPDPAEAERQMAALREELMSAFRVSGEELDRVTRMREQYDPASRPTRRAD
jgi:hypothetical protein